MFDVIYNVAVLTIIGLVIIFFAFSKYIIYLRKFFSFFSHRHFVRNPILSAIFDEELSNRITKWCLVVVGSLFMLTGIIVLVLRYFGFRLF